MFVITKSVGEYSDRTETPIYVTYTEKTAETLIEALTAEAVAEISEKLYREELYNLGYNAYITANPAPENPIVRPIFDKSREKDKEYIKEHTIRKHTFDKDWRNWHNTVYGPWNEAAYEAATEYVKAKFDPTKIVPKPGYYDLPNFYYTEVETVGEA